MKKIKYLIVFLFITSSLFFFIQMTSMAKIDPIGMYFDSEGNLRDARISELEIRFMQIRIDWVMKNIDTTPYVRFTYDEGGYLGDSLEEETNVSLNTKEKIVVVVRDNKEFFSSFTTKSEFLKYFYGLTFHLFMDLYGITNDFDNDVVVYIIPKGGLKEENLLGYFYKGEHIINKKFSN